MRMKLNSELDHRTRSSASRDRWTANRAAMLQYSTAKSRSLTASIEFCVRRGRPRASTKPSSFATASRPSGRVEPAMAPLLSSFGTVSRHAGFDDAENKRKHKDYCPRGVQVGADVECPPHKRGIHYETYSLREYYGGEREERREKKKSHRRRGRDSEKGVQRFF